MSSQIEFPTDQGESVVIPVKCPVTGHPHCIKQDCHRWIAETDRCTHPDALAAVKRLKASRSRRQRRRRV